MQTSFSNQVRYWHMAAASRIWKTKKMNQCLGNPRYFIYLIITTTVLCWAFSFLTKLSIFRVYFNKVSHQEIYINNFEFISLQNCCSCENLLFTKLNTDKGELSLHFIRTQSTDLHYNSEPTCAFFIPSNSTSFFLALKTATGDWWLNRFV